MSAESLIAAWLTDSSIAALVGTRIALHELPQGTTYPNLVYHVLSTVPDPVLGYQVGNQRAWSRVQVNPQAATLAEVEAIHAAIKALLDFKHYVTVGGLLVVSSRRDNEGPVNKDAMTLAWTKPVDYKIYFGETPIDTGTDFLLWDDGSAVLWDDGSHIIFA